MSKKDLNIISDYWLGEWKRRNHRWQYVKSVWTDSISLRFNREYWEPLKGEVIEAQKEMQELAKLIAQMEKNVR